MSNTVRKTVRGHSFLVLDTADYPHSVNIFDDPEPILSHWTFSPGEVAVDVGASFGVYTLLALAQGASVVAFEPSDDGHRILQENIRLNGWHDRAKVYKWALDNGLGTPTPAAWVEEVFGKHYPAAAPAWSRLDVVHHDIPSCAKIKIDVEGLELHVLRGAVETLRRCRPDVLIEIHDGCNPGSQIGTYPESIGSAGKIAALLGELGYAITYEDHQCGRKYLIGTPEEAR